MQLRLKEAKLRDVQAIWSWIENFKALQQWGGPTMQACSNANELAEQIGLEAYHSFVLINELDEQPILGFGQVYVREGRHHLARLIINPEYRGRGLAKALVAKLLEQANHLQEAEGASLFVAQGNLPAIACYKPLGFKEVPYPHAEEAAGRDCIFMVRQKAL